MFLSRMYLGVFKRQQFYFEGSWFFYSCTTAWWEVCRQVNITHANCGQARKAITRKFLVEHLTVGVNNYFFPCWICKCAYSQRNEPIHDLSLAFRLREGASHWSLTLIKLSYTFSRKNSHIHAWLWGWCSLGHFSSSQHSGSSREWTSGRIWFCKHVDFINITISD